MKRFIILLVIAILISSVFSFSKNDKENSNQEKNDNSAEYNMAVK